MMYDNDAFDYANQFNMLDTFVKDLIREELYFVYCFYYDTATSKIYTLSLHDALPILKYPMAPATSGGKLGSLTGRKRSTRSRRNEMGSRSSQTRRSLFSRTHAPFPYRKISSGCAPANVYRAIFSPPSTLSRRNE